MVEFILVIFLCDWLSRFNDEENESLKDEIFEFCIGGREDGGVGKCCGCDCGGGGFSPWVETESYGFVCGGVGNWSFIGLDDDTLSFAGLESFDFY